MGAGDVLGGVRLAGFHWRESGLLRKTRCRFSTVAHGVEVFVELELIVAARVGCGAWLASFEHEVEQRLAGLPVRAGLPPTRSAFITLEEPFVGEARIDLLRDAARSASATRCNEP
ncbi:MAG: hypothetical protein V9G09_11260 [Candidatus Nanopelagicales bacterium]